MEVQEFDCEFSESVVTHGICKSCKEKALEELLNKKPQNQKRR
jgi:hypothetical protein